ncbi:MAG TPA: leucyl aminopeptidase [Nitriliruptorales bacterium]
MELSIRTGTVDDADVIAIGAVVVEDGDDTSIELIGDVVTDPAALLGALVSLRFRAKADELVSVPAANGEPVTMVVGLGDRDDVTRETVRRAASAIVKAASKHAAVATTLHQAVDGGAKAVAEGAGLGAYRFVTWKTDDEPPTLTTLVLVGGDADDAELTEAAINVAATELVRDLVNRPPANKRPPQLADDAVAAVSDLPIETTVLDQAALEEGGYGGLLGVARGSSVEPRLVELRYRPDGATKHVALVGKGITFDSGGLSLKPSASMETMKMDMAGAATALGVIIGAARRELPVNITAVLCLAENMPSGEATRLADVLTAKNGTTIEVMNTDAEGRLVLADGLAHAADHEPDIIIDMATLTGAALIALGARIGVVMGTDQETIDGLIAAGERVGEPHWQLPLGLDEYGEDLSGDVADVKNHGWKDAGTIRAGIFLHKFVPDGVPWVHMDIAGVAWTDTAARYQAKGATGVPTRTVLEWLSTLER